MKFTDTEAIGMLKKVRSIDLELHIEALEPDEVDGRTDLQVLYDEAEYLLELYFEDGNVFYDDYHTAKSLLAKTKGGKLIPISIETFRPKDGYSPRDIEAAKESVNVVGRIGRLVKRLEKLGCY